ncbi:uncharacterized protein LOC117507836 [Thalassophryne amazonica]|uniref:uncharacterized protein LOC117507836 n=1 Tax=Thalassophryne amazonica TaxID=390379 RepID=UPI00147112CE|nr:uncharacterized protein LOC117507836 [Thalassophryne amazonica]
MASKYGVILEHSVILDAAEAAAAQEATDVDPQGKPRTSTSASPRRQSIKEGEMDRMLLLMQERAEESRAHMEELQKCKEQPPSTARNAFAAYVRDSLNTMSEWSYRKAKDEICRVLTKYENGAEEERVKQQQKFQQQLPHHHTKPIHTVLPVRGLQSLLSCLSTNTSEVQQLRDMLKLQNSLKVTCQMGTGSLFHKIRAQQEKALKPADFFLHLETQNKSAAKDHRARGDT